jgi:aspartate/methionine/tyrosine aminotransferase
MLNRVRLVGAVPRLASLRVVDSEWRLDLDELRSAMSDRTRVVFVNNASFPSGWVASEEEWDAIADLCRERDLWLLYWAGYEGVLFDDRLVRHPAVLPEMRERTVVVGGPTFEQRMIAWRIGWVVAPGDLVNDVSRVQIYNGLVASGFAQIGTRVALGLPDNHIAAANAEYQRRRDETLRQLDGLPAVRPAGGWSLLLDVAELGLDCAGVSDRLLEQKVAATPMRGWGGEVADRHVRFVFSNEPMDRLALLGERLHAALAAAGKRSVPRVGLEVDLSCPRCGERVLDSGSYAVGQERGRRQRATCPQCRAELVRALELEDKTWKVEDPTPPSDEELGAGD